MLAGLITRGQGWGGRRRGLMSKDGLEMEKWGKALIQTSLCSRKVQKTRSRKFKSRFCCLPLYVQVYTSGKQRGLRQQWIVLLFFLKLCFIPAGETCFKSGACSTEQSLGLARKQTELETHAERLTWQVASYVRDHLVLQRRPLTNQFSKGNGIAVRRRPNRTRSAVHHGITEKRTSFPTANRFAVESTRLKTKSEARTFTQL